MSFPMIKIVVLLGLVACGTSAWGRDCVKIDFGGEGIERSIYSDKILMMPNMYGNANSTYHPYVNLIVPENFNNKGLNEILIFESNDEINGYSCIIKDVQFEGVIRICKRNSFEKGIVIMFRLNVNSSVAVVDMNYIVDKYYKDDLFCKTP